jgi:hypothetical protein
VSRDVLPELWKAITVVAFVTLFVASLLVALLDACRERCGDSSALMTGIVCTQPKLANRKLPEFVRCPVRAADFRRTSPGQRWCSLECSLRGKRRVGAALRRNAAALPR